MPDLSPEDRTSVPISAPSAQQLMLALDWGASPLGLPSGWPAPLRAVVTTMLESHFPSYVAWGPQLCLIYNDAYARIVGARHPQAFAQPFWSVWPEVRTEIGPVIEQALAGGTVYVEDQPLVLRRHGVDEQTWFTFSVSPLRDDHGVVHGVYCVCTETTSRTVMHLALAEAEQRMSLASEAGSMGAWHWHIRKAESRWLTGMATLHGMPAGASLTTIDRYSELIHPDDRAHVQAVVEGALCNRQDHRVEYRIVRPDGSVRWLEGRGRLILDADGNPEQMAGICTDITPRKTLEQDLRFLAQASIELAQLVDPQASMERLAHLAVPGFADWCAVDVLDDDGTLRRLAVAHVDPEKVAAAMALHRRFPPDPEQERGTWGVLRSGRADMVRDITEDTLRASLQDPEHVEAIRELGLRSWIGVPLQINNVAFGVVTFVTAESGRLYDDRALELAEDLARRAAIALENARLFQAVREADRRKDVFLATLSHELRNPLAPIANALNMLRLAHYDQGKTERAVRMMERQVGQLSRLVDDLMDVARISAGKMELRTQRVHLSAALYSAMETSRPHIEAARHQLIVNLAGVPMEVDGDPVRLAQVFSNLLNNAARYTPPGGRIELRAQAVADGFEVQVRDNGMGIAPAMLKKIFTTFAQDRRPSEYSQGGLGIGLSLVDGIVRLHGGRVWASSEGEGKGSQFVVQLPAACTARAAEATIAQADPPPADDPSAKTVAGGRSILLVDDNVDAANTVADLLQLLGHRVTVAHTGAGALDQAARSLPEVILLDIGLPDFDGYEVARRLRAHAAHRNTLLIALTGWGQDRDKQQSSDAGFDHHWVKPVGLDALQALAQMKRQA